MMTLGEMICLVIDDVCDRERERERERESVYFATLYAADTQSFVVMEVGGFTEA